MTPDFDAPWPLLTPPTLDVATDLRRLRDAQADAEDCGRVAAGDFDTPSPVRAAEDVAREHHQDLLWLWIDLHEHVLSRDALSGDEDNGHRVVPVD